MAINSTKNGIFMGTSAKKSERFINYAALRILVADDFSSFRNTVFGMLQRMGVQRVETAGTAESIIELCREKRFDIILCDYNLGDGKSGQHVLEELRFKNLISRRTVFIIVSAEAARMIVMSAYECEPDDYLMKPVTSGMLQQRIDKVLMQRLVFSPVYNALEKGDIPAAIDLLIDFSVADDKYAVYAQKWLGEIFLKQEQIIQAERLYTKALESRPLDWARLGLAKCKHARGDIDIAEQTLEQLLEETPLLLPAYDVLADVCKTKNDFMAQQQVLQRAVDISPMSILRQKTLGDVAQKNKDMGIALDAKRKTVKLGNLSCYGTDEDTLAFARTAAKCIKEGVDVTPATIVEVEKAVAQVNAEPKDDSNFTPQCHALLATLHLSSSKPESAEPHIDVVKRCFNSEDEDIYAHLDYVEMLVALDNEEEIEHYLNFLLKKFAGNQTALQLLDSLLSEPASEQSKEMVANVNKEGIALYNKHQYDEAITCFERAGEMFPKHIGLQLNILQALVGKMRESKNDEQLVLTCNQRLQNMAQLIDNDNAQFERYQKIRKMAIK